MYIIIHFKCQNRLSENMKWILIVSNFRVWRAEQFKIFYPLMFYAATFQSLICLIMLEYAKKVYMNLLFTKTIWSENELCECQKIWTRFVILLLFFNFRIWSSTATNSIVFQLRLFAGLNPFRISSFRITWSVRMPISRTGSEPRFKIELQA